MVAQILIGGLLVLLSLVVPPAHSYAECESDFSQRWSCRYACCYDYNGCCANYSFSAAYWYVWLVVGIFFLVCLCLCVAGGGYGYRRRYHRYPAVVTTTTVATSNTAQTTVGYNYPAQPNTYQHAPVYPPYGPVKDAPPPYNYPAPTQSSRQTGFTTAPPPPYPA